MYTETELKASTLDGVKDAIADVIGTWDSFDVEVAREDDGTWDADGHGTATIALHRSDVVHKVPVRWHFNKADLEVEVSGDGSSDTWHDVCHLWGLLYFDMERRLNKNTKAA